MNTQRIARLEIIHLRHALSQPIQTTMGAMEHRPALLLRIEDADGAQGWGEIWCNFPPGGDRYRAELASHVLPQALAGLGMECTEPAQWLERRLHRLCLQAGEPGPVSQLAAAVDIAIHDLRARRQGVPLAEALGGKLQAVPAYASGISAARAQSQIERMRALGYRHFKQRIGYGAEDGLPQLQASAESMQPHEQLMADANQAWELPVAIERCQQLERLDLGWLEEPLEADAAKQDWQTLRQHCAMPLAGGENLRTRQDFDSAIQCNTLDVVQPDICKWGGLSGGRQVAMQAIDRNLRYCPHYLGGGIGLLASAHLLSAVGGDGLLEVDSSENPLQELLAGSLALTDGRLLPPRGAGLGVDPDPTAWRDWLVSQREHAIAPSA